MAGLLMVFTLQMLVIPDTSEERGYEDDASAYKYANVKFSHAVFPLFSIF